MFVELKEGVFYQASYDGTKVAIAADNPGLLPSSHVSTPKMSPPKEFSHCTSPTALSRALKGRCSSRHSASEASLNRAEPVRGGSSKRKADGETAKPPSKRYGF